MYACKKSHIFPYSQQQYVSFYPDMGCSVKVLLVKLP